MTTNLFIQDLFNALTLGSLYALVAISYTPVQVYMDGNKILTVL